MDKEKERAERHARKEANLRKSFKGNSTARIEALKQIIRSITVDKRPLSELKTEIDRLIAYPSNYIGCEKEYNALFLLIENNDKMKEKVSSFKQSLKKANLPQASRRYLKA